MIRLVVTFVLFSSVCFVQNMAFTWSSRSRNSGDPSYHRWAAICSNGVYWLCNLPLTLFIIQWQHKPALLAVSGIVYALSTSEGSVLMMRILMKTEKGKRQVGARPDAK